MKIAIIGGGIFGSVIARHLYNKSLGYDITIIDNEQAMAGSKCCLGLWKKTWISKDIADKVAISLPILEELFNIEEMTLLNIKTDKLDKFQYINPSAILTPISGVEYVNKEVIALHETFKFNKQNPAATDILFSDGKKRTFDRVIVAAGAWTYKLLEQSNLLYQSELTPKLTTGWGATLLVKSKKEETTTDGELLNYAPYKQAILLKQNNGTSKFGDGVVVKNHPLNDEQTLKQSQRLVNNLIAMEVHPNSILEIKEGYRPFLPKGTELVRKHSETVFSATGGGKSSVLLSGWVARSIHKLIEENK